MISHLKLHASIFVDAISQSLKKMFRDERECENVSTINKRWHKMKERMGEEWIERMKKTKQKKKKQNKKCGAQWKAQTMNENTRK